MDEDEIGPHLATVYVDLLDGESERVGWIISCLLVKPVVKPRC